jgi:hypothetical protein
VSITLLGFQIAMDDVLPVGAVERIRDLAGVAKDLVRFERTPHEPVIERLAVDVLHDDEDPIVVFADIEQCADVRVVERGDRVGLDFESVAAIRTLGVIGR